MRTRRALCCVLLLCLARVDAQCSAGSQGTLSASSNVALGKPASASTYSPGWLPSYAVNGLLTTGAPGGMFCWLTHGSTAGVFAWFGINLQSTQQITTIRYYPFLNSGMDDSYSFRVGPSSNFNTNPICATLRLVTQNLYTDVSCIATGQYVSMHINTADRNMAIVELQVYASSCTCTPCAMGTYRSTGGCGPCSNCPSNSWTTAQGATNCSCNAGHTGSFNSCSACIAGKYKAVTGSAACDNCLAGKYSSTIGVALCIACPGNSSSVSGSGSITGCYCNAGYRQTAAHDACIACEQW